MDDPQQFLYRRFPLGPPLPGAIYFRRGLRQRPLLVWMISGPLFTACTYRINWKILFHCVNKGPETVLFIIAFLLSSMKSFKLALPHEEMGIIRIIYYIYICIYHDIYVSYYIWSLM